MRIAKQVETKKDFESVCDEGKQILMQLGQAL